MDLRHWASSIILPMVLWLGVSASCPTMGFSQGTGHHEVTQHMGRLRTIGFEIGIGSASLEGNTGPSSIAVAIDQTTKRSGLSSLVCNSGAGNAICDDLLTFTTAESPSIGTTVFVRAYFNLGSLPSATAKIMLFQTAASVNLVSARVTTAGNLELWNDVAGTQIGSDSSTLLSPGTWYRVEMSYMVTNLSTFASTLMLDGVTVGSVANVSTSQAGTNNISVGWCSAPGANLVVNVDDVAINNSLGSVQNSWPGAGNIILQKPTSDNAIGGWTGGAGGLTNLFAAVDNGPPAGLAAASETDTSQIKNLVSSTTDNYDAKITDYTTAGVPATATITLVQGVCDNGQAVSTGTKTGALLIVSNPAQPAEDSFTYSGNLGTVMATWPSQWSGFWGTAQLGDIAAGSRGTAPVLRVGKRTATTREVDIDFLGLYTEYVPGTVTASAHRLALMGVGH